jgi:FkbM family methyltransferase
MFRSAIKKLLNRLGYDILHLPTDPVTRRRIELLEKHDIDMIFDIGANKGQFALKMRELGYRGRIVSFEPLPDAFSQLQKSAAGDKNWTVVNTAIGDTEGDIRINVSQNSYSSSILDILPRHVESAADSVYVGEVTAPITTIDKIILQYFTGVENMFLKIDTQGYERQVIEGCKNSIHLIKGFQLELSLIPLYAGETLMQEMVDLLRSKGFKLMLLEPGHQDYSTGELLQVEGIFYI